MDAAAKQVQQLARRIDELEKALSPFANHWIPDTAHGTTTVRHGKWGTDITVKHFRDARKALQ